MTRRSNGTGYPIHVSGAKGRYRLSDMDLDFVSLVAAGDDGLAKVVLSKAAPDEDIEKKKKTPCPWCKGHHDKGKCKVRKGNDSQEDKMGDQIAKDDLNPEVVAYIEGLEEEVDVLSKSVEFQEQEIEDLKGTLSKMAPKDEAAQEEINKALLAKADPAVRSLIEKAQADLKAQADIAKAEREARLGQVYLAKAESMPMLTEDRADLAGLLRRVADALPAEDVAKWDTILKAANEQIRTSNLFSESGMGGQPTTVSKSVESAAAELRKSDPSLTEAQAQAKVYEMNPSLFAQAMTGQEG